MGGRKIREEAAEGGWLATGADSLVTPPGGRSPTRGATERTVWQNAHGQASSGEGASCPLSSGSAAASDAGPSDPRSPAGGQQGSAAHPVRDGSRKAAARIRMSVLPRRVPVLVSRMGNILRRECYLFPFQSPPDDRNNVPPEAGRAARLGPIPHLSERTVSRRRDRRLEFFICHGRPWRSSNASGGRPPEDAPFPYGIPGWEYHIVTEPLS